MPRPRVYHASVLKHRLQIRLDDEQYWRVATRARERNTSLAAVIREAIDIALSGDLEQKRGAWERIKAAPSMELPDDRAKLKAEIETARLEYLEDSLAALRARTERETAEPWDEVR
jgi:hypothetical protein